MDFTQELKQSRKNLSDGSLKTYNSLLKSIYRNIWKDDKEPDIKNFSKVKDVKEFLKDKSPASRKTYLASLVCIAPDVDEYKKMMNEDMTYTNQEMNKQIMNDKQIESNISSAEILEVYADLKRTADHLYKKTKFSNYDLQQIQNYIIVSLLGGIYIVPRRSLDYTSMKVKNIDKNTDNYIDKNNFVFNKFKTAKFHPDGQMLEIPKELKKILNKWIMIIPDESEYLLFNSKLEPLSNVTLNQRLNLIFHGPISVNQMRHTYLTEKYANLMKKQKVMEEDMENMGSSTKQAKVYVKLK